MRFHDISFSFPQAFFLILLAPAIILAARRSFTHMPVWQKVLSTAWRILTLLVFAAALSNPSILRTSSRICVATIVDVSKSVPAGSFETTAAWLERLEEQKPEGAVLKHFAFAGRITPLTKEDLEAPAGPDASGLDDEKTDLESAVLHAVSLLPQDCSRRIVAVTDGYDTQHDTEGLPGLLARSGVRIFPARPPRTKVSEVILEEMKVPPVVRTDAAFNVRIIAYSSEPADAKIKIWDKMEGGEKKTVEEKELRLEKGTNTLAFTVKIEDEGKHLVGAEIVNVSKKELMKENNMFESAVLARGPNKVLYVEGQPGKGGHLRSALQSAGYRVKLEGPHCLAAGAGLEDYDAVFLSDVPYGKLPGGAVGKIKKYTAGGGVLIFAGGKNSYSMGGYRGTPMEPYLPVSMDIEKEIQKVSTAVILVLDKSGSMSGLPVKMAKQAAKASISVLDPETMVEVISFDSSPRRLFHMQKARNKMMLGSFISQIYSGGGTNIIGALKTALADLVPVQAKKKHIVLLTDGQSSKAGIESILSRASGNKISISTIGLGQSVDRAFLEKISVETGGKAYFTSNPKSLPRLFMQEMRVVTPPAVVEGVIDVRVKKYMPFIGKVGGGLPYLRGYNLTSHRGGRAVTVLVSDRQDPILAMWKHGKGWVVAFTSDVKARWGAPWASWKLMGKFWSELIRFLAGKEEKKEEEKKGKLKIRVEGKKVTVATDLVDETTGKFMDGATGEGRFARFDAKTEKRFEMAQTAPGRYEGGFAIDDYGAYFIDTEMKTALGFVEKAHASLNIPYPPEYRKIGADEETLALTAEKSGGALDPSPGQVWSREGSEIEHARALWPYLVLLLLLLVPLDIAIRRLPL